MSETELQLRHTAIHLLRSGHSPVHVAQQLNRSLAWVYKWQRRFGQQREWSALNDRSRAPLHQPYQLAEEVRMAIRQARSILEAQASQPDQLSYIGAAAVRGQLQAMDVSPLPSLTTIERELRVAGMVRRLRRPTPPVVAYPHLTPTAPLQLVQVDILPHTILGGAAVACFNAIDVVSRYPTARALPRKRAADAVSFLVQVWQELGVPDYTQVDNEGCFSGGATHAGVLGQVVRVSLLVGTQLLFSPIRHPASNGTVERFHQDYHQHVWEKCQLADVAAVEQAGRSFVQAYRQSRHHSALHGHAPAEVHPAPPLRRLEPELKLPARLPLRAGKVHFLRLVRADRTVQLLNLSWAVPAGEPGQGVWATLLLTVSGAWLRIYDRAPDASARRLLVEHRFPLSEAVQPSPAPEREGQGPTDSLGAFLKATLDLTLGTWLSGFLRCAEGCDGC